MKCSAPSTPSTSTTSYQYMQVGFSQKVPLGSSTEVVLDYFSITCWCCTKLPRGTFWLKPEVIAVAGTSTNAGQCEIQIPRHLLSYRFFPFEPLTTSQGLGQLDSFCQPILYLFQDLEDQIHDQCQYVNAVVDVVLLFSSRCSSRPSWIPLLLLPTLPFDMA